MRRIGEEVLVKIFVDTDVLVDVALDRAPHAATPASVLEMFPGQIDSGYEADPMEVEP